MLRILVLHVLFHGGLNAQTPTVIDPLGNPIFIEKGLQSTTPLEVAVSASDAGIFLKDTAQRAIWLRQALARSLSLQPQSEAIRTQRIILDTLIRTKTSVPLAELFPFFDQFPAAVVAVVAKGDPPMHEDRFPLLLKAEEQKNLACWYAAVALARTDKKQLIHHLASNVKFDYPITIVDQDFLPVRKPMQVLGGVPGGALGGVIGGVIGGLPDRVPWPDQFAYSLETTGDPDQILTSGPGQTTYLKRLPLSPQPGPEGSARSYRPFPNSGWADHDRDVVRTLLWLFSNSLRTSYEEDVPNLRGGEATIVWHSPEQAASLLKQAIDQYVHECGVMLKKLGEPAETEPELRGRVRVWIRDRRETKTAPIPDVGGGAEFNLCSVHQPHTNSKCVD